MNPNCRPFFAVYIREVSSKKPKDFFGVYRYFAGADSEYWHGALKKSFLVGVWRVYFFSHWQSTIPQILHPGSRLVAVYLVYAGVAGRQLGLMVKDVQMCMAGFSLFSCSCRTAGMGNSVNSGGWLVNFSRKQKKNRQNRKNADTPMRLSSHCLPVVRFTEQNRQPPARCGA